MTEDHTLVYWSGVNLSQQVTQSSFQFYITLTDSTRKHSKC